MYVPGPEPARRPQAVDAGRRRPDQVRLRRQPDVRGPNDVDDRDDVVSIQPLDGRLGDATAGADVPASIAAAGRRRA